MPPLLMGVAHISPGLTLGYGSQYHGPGLRKSWFNLQLTCYRTFGPFSLPVMHPRSCLPELPTASTFMCPLVYQRNLLRPSTKNNYSKNSSGVVASTVMGGGDDS